MGIRLDCPTRDIGKFLRNKGDISEADLKKAIQKIDSEVNWDDPAMDVANEVMMKIRFKLDDYLKRLNPEYRTAMQDVAPKAQLYNNILKEMRLKRGSDGLLEATDLTYTKLKGLQRATGDSSRQVSKSVMDELGEYRSQPAGFMDDLELTQLYDQTKGGVTQGSRGVQIGAAGGAIAAGGFDPLTMATGALIGAAKDKYGRSAGGALIPKMAPAIKGADRAMQSLGRGLESAGAKGIGESVVDSSIRAGAGHMTRKIGEDRQETTAEVRARAVDEFLDGNGGEPEPGIRSEGFADIFRPFKDIAMEEMDGADVPPGVIAAFDLLTPDSMNFLLMLKRAPERIMQMAESGNGKVISMLDYIRRKTSQDPKDLARHVPDSRSRDQKIDDALRRQRGESPDGSYEPFKPKLRPEPMDARPRSQRADTFGPVQVLKERLQEASPKAAVTLETLRKKGHTEPYYGLSFDNAAWSTNNSRFRDMPQPLPVFGRVDPKGHLGKSVARGGPDPFAWMDTKYGISRAVLRDHRDKPLKISTRSDLITHDDYISLLNPRYHSVEIHIPTDNARIARQLEPGAPSIKRRLEAARKLKEAGIPVTIVHDRIEGMKSSLNSFNGLDLYRQHGIPMRVNDIKPDKKALEMIKKLGFGWDD